MDWSLLFKTLIILMGGAFVVDLVLSMIRSCYSNKKDGDE